MNGAQTAGAVVGAGAAGLLLAGLLLLVRVPLLPHPRDTSRRQRSAPRRGGRSGWDVTVEVARLGLAAGGALAYRVVSAPVGTSAAPDQVALDLAGLAEAGPGAVVHATSWRYEDAGHLVLTYAAVPCALDSASPVLTGTGVLCSPDPLRPTPPGLHEHHVVAHAARHLAYLAERDPVVREAVGLDAAPWQALLRTVRDMPDTEHLDTHALARRWSA